MCGVTHHWDGPKLLPPICSFQCVPVDVRLVSEVGVEHTQGLGGVKREERGHDGCVFGQSLRTTGQGRRRARRAKRARTTAKKKPPQVSVADLWLTCLIIR